MTNEAGLEFEKDLTYKIIKNNNLPYETEPDDYIGLVVYISGEYKTTFTGFLEPDLMRKLLNGEGEELK